MNKRPGQPMTADGPPPQAQSADFPFILEWRRGPGPSQVKVLARLRDIGVAVAAWQAAVDERPGACIVLRQSDQILRISAAKPP